MRQRPGYRALISYRTFCSTLSCFRFGKCLYTRWSKEIKPDEGSSPSASGLEYDAQISFSVMDAETVDGELASLLEQASHVPPAAYLDNELSLVGPKEEEGEEEVEVVQDRSTDLFETEKAKRGYLSLIPTFDIAQYCPDLIQKGNSNAKDCGLPDPLYSLVLKHLSSRRKGGEPWLEEVSAAIHALRPKRKEGLHRWFKDWLADRGFALGTWTEGNYLTKEDKVVVSQGMLDGVYKLVHSIYGHGSTTMLVNKVLQYFYLPKGLTAKIREVGKQFFCPGCKQEQALPKKDHIDSIVTTRVFERIQVDATEIATERLAYLRGRHGFRYLLTIVDCLSKMAFAFALKTLTVEETVGHLKGLFSTYMIPEILQSDNGRQFKNKLLASLKTQSGYKHLFGAPYTPQHQGQVERFNRTFKVQLFRWIRSKKETAHLWPERIEAELACYNSTTHSSTGFPPELVFFGRLRSPTEQKKLERQEQTFLRFLDDASCRFPDSPELRVAGQSALSAQIVHVLESRHEIARLALDAISKRNAYNRLYLQGTRVRASALLRPGTAVWFPRPNRRDQMSTPNVKGFVVKESVLSRRYLVRYEEDGKSFEVWEDVNRLHFDPTAQVTLSVPRIWTWPELRRHIPEFVNIELGAKWKDTQSLAQEFKWSDDDEEMQVENLLGLMSLPDPATVSTDRYAEAILLEMIDQMFLRFVGVEFHEKSPVAIQDEDMSLLIRYLFHLGFRLFLGTSSLWKSMRTDNPQKLYALFLGATSSTKHSCYTCFSSGSCNTEHICCMKSVLQKTQELGWLTKSSTGNYYTGTQALAGDHAEISKCEPVPEKKELPPALPKEDQKAGKHKETPNSTTQSARAPQRTYPVTFGISICVEPCRKKEGTTDRIAETNGWQLFISCPS